MAMAAMVRRHRTNVRAAMHSCGSPVPMPECRPQDWNAAVIKVAPSHPDMMLVHAIFSC